jgi:hypothetical protein
MLTVGVSVAGLFLLGGFAFKTKRIYVYAFVTLVMFVGGYFLTFPLYYYLIALTIMILTVGLAMMIRFVNKYPKATQTMGA